MYLGLMTNAAGLTDASIHANITTPTGAGSYAIKELTDGSWTISSLGAGLGYSGVFAKQSFTASGADYSANVTGFYIYADDNAAGVKYLMWFCYTGISEAVTNGLTFSVTPTIELADGTLGQVADEGAKVCLELVLNDSSADRTTGGLGIALYTNSTGLSNSSAYADMVEPTGGTYADKSPADPAYTVSAGAATLADQDFVASGAAFSPAIYGYFPYFQDGTTNKMLAYDPYTGAPVTVADGDTYRVSAT